MYRIANATTKKRVTYRGVKPIVFARNQVICFCSGLSIGLFDNMLGLCLVAQVLFCCTKNRHHRFLPPSTSALERINLDDFPS